VWPDVPDKVEADLSSADATVRRGATEAVATLGAARATPLVLRALKDADDGVRLVAAQSAIRVRIPAATAMTLSWLGEHDARLRIAACEVARALPDPRAVAPLARALSDSDAEVRRAAVEALGAQEPKDAVAPLLGKLDDATPAVRVEIARALARLGDPRAVVPLIGKVEDSVPDVRQAVARALGELGDVRAAPALVLQLRDTLADVRVAALSALARLKGADAIDAIAPLMQDRNAEVRHAAVAALGRLGSSAAVRALVARLGLDDDTGAGLERTPVRDALVRAGAESVAPLRTMLEHTSSPAIAASAAWVLGELRVKESGTDIALALRRGSLPAAAALHALVGAGAPDALPLVLEFVDDDNPGTRNEAFAATEALLDPAHPDGRAVEPLLAAAQSPHLRPVDRVKLVGLLGRTRAARVAPLLAGLLRSRDLATKLAAVDALGTLGPAGADPALLELLADRSSAETRLRAAIALATSGSSVARDAILKSLDEGQEVDRAAAWTALAGILTREPTDRAWGRLAASLEVAAGGERDAILLALGRAAPMALVEKLAREGDADDRRTLAAATGARADAVSFLGALLGDASPSVRAAAAWSLGEAADAGALRLLVPLASGPFPDAATNAAAAIGRIVARTPGDPATAALCALAARPLSLVQANALVGLSMARARCGDGILERGLVTASSAEVRAAAVRAVGTHPLGPEDMSALARCASTDRQGSVAVLCNRFLAAAATHPTPATPALTHPVEVYVEAGTRAEPRPLAPFVVELADGLLRAGVTDRRGAFFDARAPEGDLTLHLPEDSTTPPGSK